MFANPVGRDFYMNGLDAIVIRNIPQFDKVIRKDIYNIENKGRLNSYYSFYACDCSQC